LIEMTDPFGAVQVQSNEGRSVNFVVRLSCVLTCVFVYNCPNG
jgi:hypothetical protein